MTTELDLSLDYEQEVLNATWEGFVKWAEDQELITRNNLNRLPMYARMAFSELHWDEYVEDLQSAYMDSIENQRMKWANA